MKPFTYVIRVVALVSILVALVAGRLTNRWDDAVDAWNRLDFEVRTAVLIVFGWPVVGYVTPVLLDLWGAVAANAVGLGSRYLPMDPGLLLSVVTLCAIGLQTGVVVTKLNNIDDQL